MGLIDQIGMETEMFHAATDEDLLIGSPTPVDYRRYLTRMYGFVLPVERSILSSPGIERYIDTPRFQKHELLRRDLNGLRMRAEQIEDLPLCSVPLFETPEEALGWAYLIERSTLRHGDLFRLLASSLPGENAFSSSYLKCYLGTVGEMWRSFGHALEVFEGHSARRGRMIEAATAAFRCFRSWRSLRDQREGVAIPITFAVIDLKGDD